MLKGIQIQIYPNKTQASEILRTLGTGRFIWNTILSDDIKSYNETGKFKHRSKKQLKEEFPWMKEVGEQPKDNVFANYRKAMQNRFSKTRKKKAGFPRFKSKRGTERYSVCTTRWLKDGRSDAARIDSKNRIKLSRLGEVKFCSGFDFEFLNKLKVNKYTITKTCSGKFYCSLLADVDVPAFPASTQCIGIDLGIKDFAVCSDGKKFKSPDYKKIDDRIKILQKNYSRTQKGSHNREKARIRLALAHERKANKRKDFLHKLSSKLVNENQVICLEDLNVQGMLKNHSLARSISNQGWTEFVSMLDYKSKWYGRETVKTDRFYPSSKTCSECGHKNDGLTLNDREWVCPSCGCVLDRDLNAAKNILQEGIKSLNRRADGDSLCKLGMKGDEAKYIMDSPIEQEWLTETSNQRFG